MPVDMPMTLEDAQRLYERPAEVRSAEDAEGRGLSLAASARAGALVDAAVGLGLKSGMAWQLHNIEAVVARQERQFDTVYDFGHYMIRDRVVPPVISEARDVYSQEGDFALRLSGAHYRIESQAKFSSLPPSWRGYLSFPRVKTGRNDIPEALLPRDGLEEQIWRDAVADGWEQGVEQANLMLENALDRMNRDILGMIRFHTFLTEGRITMPAIASESIAVTMGGETMAVDETLLRITTLPEFNGRVADWGSTIRSAGAGEGTPP